MEINLTVESPMAGPAITAMLCRVLQDAGATIRSDDPRVLPLPERKPDLSGLTVRIARVVWTVDREKKLADATELAALFDDEMKAIIKDITKPYEPNQSETQTEVSVLEPGAAQTNTNSQL